MPLARKNRDMAKMTKFKLEIDLSNAAFDDNPASEIARILDKLAYEIGNDGGLGPKNLYDVNGNAVGHTSIMWRGFPRADRS